MKIYVENPMESTKELIYLISEFSTELSRIVWPNITTKGGETVPEENRREC